MVIHDLLLNVKEHQFYKKHRTILEKKYDVKIFLPNVISSPSVADIIFGTMVGSPQNVKNVENYISKSLNKSLKSSNDTKSNDLIIVSLSDSEEECASAFESVESASAADKLKSGNSVEYTNSIQSSEFEDSICIIESTSESKKFPSDDKADSFEDSVCIIECIVNDKCHKSKSNDQAVSSSSLEDTACIVENPCSQSNQENVTDALKIKMARVEKRKNRKGRKKDFKRCKLHDETEICQNTSFKNSQAAPEFIALHEKNDCGITSSFAKSVPTIEEERDNDIIIIDEPVKSNVIAVPIMKPVLSRYLRPIVIDGSNVARVHGKVTDTFSSKGIKLCINYFLDRGHTEVTAFVPNFRRHGDRRKFCPTTDQSILEELAKCGKVVFTPSRKVNGQCYASYDDRFIVELASRNGGVIVSNDNFKDLLHENESFKEAIEKRLLMYCFVGDLFMVPNDPLGRNGPALDEYLSFPENHSQNIN